MPVRVCTGFDHGHSNATGLTKGNAGNRLFDSITGTPAIVSSAPVRTGTYGLEISSSAAQEYVSWTTDTLSSSQTRCVLNFWFRFPSSLPSADVSIAEIWSLNDDARLYFRNSDDKLVAVVDGFSSGIGSSNAVVGPVVTADTWYHIEMYSDVSGNPNTLDWTVDGVAQTQGDVALGSTTISRAVLGSDASQTMTCRYDDVVVWTDTAEITSYPFGPHSVKLLKPDTGGSTAEIGTANATARFTGNATADATHNSANILTAISEVPPLIGATATGICQRTSGLTNACGIPMTTYTLGSGETITALRILVCGWAGSATANTFGMRTFNGTTEDILFGTSISSPDPNFDNNTTSPAWLCKMATAASFDTQSEIDALVVRVGYSTDISPLPGAHAVYAELAVKESTTTTITLDLLTENDTILSPGLIHTMPLLTENNNIFNLGKALTMPQLIENDTVFAAGKILTLSLLTENDTIFDFPTGTTIILDLLTENNSIFNLNKMLTLGLLTENDTLFNLDKMLTLGLLTENDTVFNLNKLLTLGLLTENDTIFDLVAGTTIVLSLLTENDSVFNLDKMLTLGLLTENDTVLNLSKGLALSLLTENDSILTLSKIKELAHLVENDTIFNIIVSGGGFEPTESGAGSVIDKIMAGLVIQGFLVGTVTDRERARLHAKLSTIDLSTMDLYRQANERPRIQAVDLDG